MNPSGYPSGYRYAFCLCSIVREASSLTTSQKPRWGGKHKHLPPAACGFPCLGLSLRPPVCRHVAALLNLRGCSRSFHAERLHGAAGRTDPALTHAVPGAHALARHRAHGRQAREHHGGRHASVTWPWKRQQCGPYCLAHVCEPSCMPALRWHELVSRQGNCLLEMHQGLRG